VSAAVNDERPWSVGGWQRTASGAPLCLLIVSARSAYLPAHTLPNSSSRFRIPLGSPAAEYTRRAPIVRSTVAAQRGAFDTGKDCAAWWGSRVSAATCSQVRVSWLFECAPCSVSRRVSGATPVTFLAEPRPSTDIQVVLASPRTSRPAQIGAHSCALPHIMAAEPLTRPLYGGARTSKSVWAHCSCDVPGSKPGRL
jgi:hypothetical protein